MEWRARRGLKEGLSECERERERKGAKRRRGHTEVGRGAVGWRRAREEGLGQRGEKEIAQC